jgi:arginyl-tRNA synthetase
MEAGMNDFDRQIHDAVKDSLKRVFDLDADESVLKVETPRDPKMGDYAVSTALRLAKTLHKAPMDIAAPLCEDLQKNFPAASSVEAVKPGFINFRMSKSALSAVIPVVLAQGDTYGHNETGKGVNVLVEWVSANPTGRLHCGHARNAAWGDCICRLYEASGYNCLREYYVNDAGNQMVMLGESLISRYFEHFGKEYPLPENGYHAQDIIDIANDIAETDGDKWLTADPKERLAYFRQEGDRRELKQIEEDLKYFRCDIKSWVHETFFYENDAKRIKDCFKIMADKGLTYEKDGALWFKSTVYGDDKDRPLRKSDGTLTYLAPDIANHVYKYERGYQLLIDLWGADHHSYVSRMLDALKAVGLPDGTLHVDLIQMVRMVEDGVEVKMSKRTGNAITLRELCDDLGVDATRWFFVSKDVATQMDLDLKLARSKDNNNPVYYAQYAYSRMHSILTRPDAPEFVETEDYGDLTDEKELRLMKMISDFPKTVADAARDRKPNKITEFIMDFVKTYHSYYNSTRVLNLGNDKLTNERIGLTKACMITLKNAFDLIGVSAPESM